MKMTTWLSTLLVAFGSVFAVVPATFATQHGADQPNFDEERLVKRIKQEILDELRSENFLAEQIERGIKSYIDGQRRAARNTEARTAIDKAKRVRPVSVSRDHIRGNPDAEISLIEYSDFECPYCKRFHPIPSQLLEEYGGRVNWVYRHFPLAFHNPGAQKQAEGTECANELGGNDAFWRYSDLIYERTQSNGNGFPLDRLVPLAVEIGLEKGKFQRCLDSGKYAQHVQDDYEEALEVGVSGTPGNILLNNKTKAVVPRMGAASLAVLKADVDRLLQ